MKKLLLFCLILGFILTNLSFSAKGQDFTFRKNAEIALRLYQNKPTELDSAETWRLILGLDTISRPIIKNNTEFRYQGLLQKTNTWTNKYYIDTLSHVWAYRTENNNQGDWEINLFIIGFLIFLILGIILMLRINIKRGKFKLPM